MIFQSRLLDDLQVAATIICTTTHASLLHDRQSSNPIAVRISNYFLIELTKCIL
jgi:hypothetical protein